MPTTIDLDTLPVNKDYRQPLDQEPGVGVKDYGRAAVAGAYGVLGSTAAGVDYLADSDEDSALKGVRRFADEGAKAQVEAMTPAARDALNAGFLPGGDKSIWSPDVSIASSLGLKLANASPSLLASVIPGGLVAGAARGALSAGAAVTAGTATSGALNAAQMGGQVYDDIEKSILEAKEDYLKANSPVYAKLRDDGYSDTVARKVLVEAAAGNRPLLVGAVGAIAEQFGAAAMAAKGAVGHAAEGVFKGAKRAGKEEAITEAAQNALQETSTQSGQMDAGTLHDFDFRKILEQTVQGGTLGGIMGAAVGGVTGLRGKAEGASGEQRVPDTTTPEVSSQAIEPVVREAAGDGLSSGRRRAETALNDADAGLRKVQETRQAVDPAVQAAVDGGDEVAPRSNEPLARDEYEADADHTPGAISPEPASQQPQEPAQAAPQQASPPVEPQDTRPAQTAADGPSEIQQTPAPETNKPVVAQTIDLDAFLDNDVAPQEQQPRVLRSVQEPATPREPGPITRLTAAERQRVAKGEAVAAGLSTDPADFTTQKDRLRVKKLAEATISERGEAAPQWARDVVETLAQNRRGQGPAAKAAREKYAAARQALADETLEKVSAGARRETADEVRNRQVQERRYRDGTEAERIVGSTKVPRLAERGVPKAVREYAASLIEKAKAGKIDLKAATDDEHLLHLRTAAEVARPGSSVEQVQQFIADDFFLRRGEEGMVRNRRRAEMQKHGASYDEAETGGRAEREGTDSSEAYDAEGSRNEAASQEHVFAGERDDLSLEPVSQPIRLIVQDDDQRKPSAIVAPLEQSIVAGKDRSGQFKVEGRGRRRVREVAERKAARTEPTLAQKEAGNYPMDHVRVSGLDVSIENRKGAIRSGEDKGGKKWSVKMPADYGYIKGTKGVDGDHVDVYLGPERSKGGPVYVVNQQNLDGTFDEHKAMLGFPNEADALRTYKAGFSDGKGGQRVGSVVEMSTEGFKEWLAGDIKGPAKVQPRTTRQEIEAAYLKITNGETGKAVRLSKLREALPNLDRATVDQGLAGILKGDPTASLSQFSDPRSLDAAERAAAYSPAGEPFHVVRFNSQPRAMRARGRDTSPEAHAREIARLLGDEPEVRDTGRVVTSSRSGAQADILSSGTLGSYLNDLDHKRIGGVAAQVNPFIARRLTQIVPDVQVHVVSKDGMRALVADLVAKGNFPDQVAGYYDPASHEIILAEDDTKEAELSHLLIHEGLHAAFMQTIERTPAARQLIRTLMQEVRDHLGSAATAEYGMLNEHEFVSEAFSSRDFQEKLSRIPVSRSYAGLPGNSVWGLFIAGIKKFLRLMPVQSTALDAALRIGAVLTDLRTATSEPSTPRTPYAAPRALGTDAVREGFSDIRGAGRIVSSAVVLRARTLDQIRQGYRHLFPAGDGADHLDKLVEGMQRQHAFVDGKSRDADLHVRDFLDLKRTAPKVAQDFAVLANDVTMAGINLLKGKPALAEMQAVNRHVYGLDPEKSDIAAAWQAKALHADLQRRFSALPAAVQDQFVRAADFYRGTQNETARAFVVSILDQLGPEMSAGRRADLVTRTLANTLTEEDRTGLGSTLYTALKEASAARSVEGMYFPLKRHGDYVVRTRDEVGDTKGGLEIEPGVVEFAGGSDKEARKRAEAFARSTELRVTRVAKRYYDGETGEPIKAADADKGAHVTYRVTVQTHGLHMFESAVEAERFVREARRDGSFDGVEDVQHREGMEQRGDLSHSQLSALTRSVDQRDDLTPGQRDVLKTAIAQAAIRLMSGNRIQKHSLARKFYAGASDDFGRNMLQYATAQSNFLGKLKYMPGIRGHLSAMEAQAKAFNADKSQIRKLVFDEVRDRVNNNDAGLAQPSRFVRDLMQVAMLSKLAGPSHSIINAAQPLMTTLPVLGGEHGMMTASLELARSMRDIGAWREYGTGVANTYKAARHVLETTIDAADPVGSIRKKLARQPDGVALGRVLTELQERGTLGDGAEFEMASAIASGRGAVGTAIAKADRVFRQAPAAVEAVNRAGSAVAAYRLARRKGMSEKQATQYAFDVVQQTQFDYSRFNAPPMFNRPMLRPFLQFKKYGQAMTDLYAGMLYRAFRNDSKADRLIAIRQFGALAGMHGLVAGAFALPGLEAVKIGATVAAALGVGGGWQDQQRRIRRYIEQAAGKGWADVVASGAVSHVLGVDLSSRMSAADLWTFGEPKKFTGSEIGGWIGLQLLSASGSTMLDMRDGLIDIEDGDYLKGAIKIVPAKALADLGKAFAGATGATRRSCRQSRRCSKAWVSSRSGSPTSKRRCRTGSRTAPGARENGTSCATPTSTPARPGSAYGSGRASSSTTGPPRGGCDSAFPAWRGCGRPTGEKGCGEADSTALSI